MTSPIISALTGNFPIVQVLAWVYTSWRASVAAEKMDVRKRTVLNFVRAIFVPILAVTGAKAADGVTWALRSSENQKIIGAITSQLVKGEISLDFYQMMSLIMAIYRQSIFLNRLVDAFNKIIAGYAAISFSQILLGYMNNKIFVAAFKFAQILKELFSTSDKSSALREVDYFSPSSSPFGITSNQPSLDGRSPMEIKQQAAVDKALSKQKAEQVSALRMWRGID